MGLRRVARDDGYPLHEHVPYFDLYRKQVVKQADLILALHWCGERFSLAGEGGRVLRTTRSSPCATPRCRRAPRPSSPPRWGTWSWPTPISATAALVDLQDRKNDTEDGLHMASLAGAWIGLVCGFGGLRDHGDRLRFARDCRRGSSGWPSRSPGAGAVSGCGSLATGCATSSRVTSAAGSSWCTTARCVTLPADQPVELCRARRWPR